MGIENENLIDHAPREIRDQTKRKLYTAEEISELLGNPSYAEIIAHEFNNRYFPEIQLIMLQSILQNYEYYKQGLSFSEENLGVVGARNRQLAGRAFSDLTPQEKQGLEDEVENLVRKQIPLYQDLINTEDPIQMLTERELEPGTTERRDGASNLKKWIGKLRDRYGNNVTYELSDYSPTYKSLAAEAAEHNAENVKAYLNSKYKDANGVVPDDIQDQMINEIRQHIEQNQLQEPNEE